jgi:hypothetical protein
MKISKNIRQLIEGLRFVFVASSDTSGCPHMAIGEQIAIAGDCTLVFENWFCPITLQNIAGNPHVSVVAVLPDTGNGFQLIGSVVKSADIAILDGYAPALELPMQPQVLTKFTVRVDKILEFTAGIHSDLPMASCPAT